MIPTPVYELLPYGYVFLGILAAAGLETILGKVCGALLIIVGIIVYQARMRYRHRKVRPANMAEAKAHNGSRPQTETSRRNTADPVSQVRLNPEQDFEKGAASEEGGNYQEALQWYRKAADQDYAPAQVNLGALYAEGHGTPQDFQEAMRWYRKAASQNYEIAQFNLGVMYAAGEGGITKDPVMAYVWFSQAALRGDADARKAKARAASMLNVSQRARAEELLHRSSRTLAEG